MRRSQFTFESRNHRIKVCRSLSLLFLCFSGKPGKRIGIEIIGRWLLGLACEPCGKVLQLRSISISLVAKCFQLNPVAQPSVQLAKIYGLERSEQGARRQEVSHKSRS